jgi:coenzyme PQQ precursor peptide PqqA
LLNEPCCCARTGQDKFPLRKGGRAHSKEIAMVWTTPILVEICIGLEINGYLPAEF